MKPKIFIDGSEGTTGLKIFERFATRDDLEVVSIASDKRKDVNERKKHLNAADVAFLCLPDEAARESVSLLENDTTVIIDTSTAHRTAAGWAYGFPELSPAHRQAIATGKRIAVPGCHATGFIALVYPLVKRGLLSPDYPLTASSISGYSGAGKGMIAEYENAERSADYDAPRLYALGQKHKHLPEMTQVCGLSRPPLFNPIIADYYRGMVVYVPLFASAFLQQRAPSELVAFYREYYQGEKLIAVADYDETAASNFLCSNGLAGRDDLIIHVTGNDERLVLCAQFDNLGKGASGAAVQCMELVLGKEC
ncbi:MAG: N-acetyl-gamma-glutamyl-phosphate reductase [Lachnospiraceae bacterium]|jgi:N-acetyl-gamma-glutamyl-phosphate reductase|nr:N-acetyl-gamma-glutamyl-phosphate reductase [Lachnospiraceae bacterium]